MKKLFGILLLSLLALVLPTVSAQTFAFTDIEVEGINMDVTGIDNPVVYAERGSTVNIRVVLEALEDVEDLKIKAWIGGYEYDDIEDVTDMFDVAQGVTIVKYLSLQIPEDIDASEEYTLNLKAYSQNENLDGPEMPLMIEEQRHLLNIQDVIFSPGLSLNKETPLFVTVRVENMGDKKEEDVKVEISIPALGITQVDYIDELTGHEDDEEDIESSESTNALFLDLSNVAPGTYTLNVNVEYNNGHSETSKTYDLTITGAAQPTTSQDVIDVANKIKTIAQGESVVYKIDIANLGNAAKTYSAEVLGLDTWATSRVDPSFVLIQAGGTGELYVYVSAKEDATEGQHLFTVKVKEGSNVVKEINLESNVPQKAVKRSAWSNVIKGLEFGFIILLVILVILGIIIAITKMRSSSEETGSSEGQTYY